MKLKNKLRVIIPCSVIAVGIILIIVGFIKGAAKDYVNALELNEFEANVSAAGIYNIDIDVELANLNIVSTNDVEDFKIEADNITKDLIEYTTSNNTLKLIYKTKKWYSTIFIPAYNDANGKIILYIPADIDLKEVEVNATYGELSVNYITADRVNINCATGDNHIKNLNCGYAEINNSGANLNGVNINADEIDLNLDSDKAVFSNFTTQSLVLKNKGDLILSGIITGDSTLKSDKGDVEITLYGEKSDYSFKSVDGNATVNGKKPELNEDAKYHFETLGDMKLKIE